MTYVPFGLAACIAVVVWYWRRAWLRDLINSRLKSESTTDEPVDTTERPFARRHFVLPWVVGVIVSATLIVGFAFPTKIAVAIGFVMALVLTQVDAWILERRINKIETQLAECIDVLVASVRAGSSLQNALEIAARDTRQPLQRELEEMVARLRLGDPPSKVFEHLRQRVPIEPFRLFCTTLTVNWEVGGGLAVTLAAVGQTIRDRMTIGRQIRALSTQGRITTMSVLSVTYFLFAMMWQTDPMRMVGFLRSVEGEWMVAAAIVMQGIGIAMVAKISRPKV